MDRITARAAVLVAVGVLAGLVTAACTNPVAESGQPTATGTASAAATPSSEGMSGTRAGTTEPGTGAMPDRTISTEGAPDGLAAWAGNELDVGDAAYPDGGGPPSLVELMPTIEGGTVVSSDDDEIRVSTPTAVTVIARGDIAVHAANDLECRWIEAFVNASDLGDAQAEERAAAGLRALPDSPMRQVRPEEDQAQAQAEVIEPMLAGDVDMGRSFLNGSCGIDLWTRGREEA